MNTLSVNTEKQHALSPHLHMQFMEPLGTADSSVDAAWDFLHQRWRPEVLEATRALGPSMIRWGGCFASYYRWREAVGPMDERVPMLNLCWDGIFQNQVGTREFIAFCRAVGAEPLLTVNMESDGRMHWAYPAEGIDRFGCSDEAADWVRYCNDADHPERRAHGDEAPFGVRYWQIGNETSYDTRGYDVEKTAQVTRDFALKMREADPSIRLIAWGDDGWTPRVLEHAGDAIDMVAFHHHFDSGLPDSPLRDNVYREDPDRTWAHLMHAHRSLDEHIRRMRRDLGDHPHKLAMTEGHFALAGRDRCDVLSTWAAGVAYARCLNVQARHGDVLEIATMADFCGNRWQVNALMIPTPMRETSRPYLQPVGQVMALFGAHRGTHSCAVEAPEPLDVCASADDDHLYLHVVNSSLHEAQRLALKIDGQAVRRARVVEIAADPWFEVTELAPEAFAPTERTLDGEDWQVPAASVSVVIVERGQLDTI